MPSGEVGEAQANRSTQRATERY